MPRVVVILGSSQEAEAAPAALPKADQAAVGLALQRFTGAVEAYCLRDDTEALRYALAAGAVTAQRLIDVTSLDFDVVLVGSGGAEPYGDLLLAQLAERQQAAMVFDVLDVVPEAAGLTVIRDLGRGSREVLRLHGPAVLGIAEEAVQLLYVSRYRRQQVQLSRHTAATASPDAAFSAIHHAWEPVRPRVKSGAVAARTGGTASARRQALFGMLPETHGDAGRAHVIVADATTCAQYLLRFLGHHSSIGTAEARPPAASLPRPTPMQEAPRRGPRPLTGDPRGLERQPRPFAGAVAGPRAVRPATPARGPRPVGRSVSQRQRGPRPLPPQEAGDTEA